MTTRSSFTWEVPPTVLASNIVAWGKRLLIAVYKLALVFMDRIVTYAKKNARWTDRTSNARQGLSGDVLKTATGVILVLSHGVDYGKWLEIANAGKYAIILEALEANYSPLMAALEALVRG